MACDLQHQRLAELSRELRLNAVPDLYSVIAQSAAAKSASFADFLEEILRAERDARWAARFAREQAYMLLSIIGELRVGTSPRPVMATRLIVPKGAVARGRLER